MRTSGGAVPTLAGILVVTCLQVTATDSGGVKKYRGIIYNERCLTAQPEWLPFAHEHSLECAMLQACFLSGYHLVVDAKTTYKLDRRGELLARRLLLRTRKRDDFRVLIRGRLKDSQLMVQTLEEVK